MTMSNQFISFVSVSGFRNAFLALPYRVFSVKYSWQWRYRIRWLKSHENLSRCQPIWREERRHLEPRWGLASSQLPNTHENFSSNNENAATICHSFLVKCRFRLCLTQSTKKKLKLVYLKMLVGTLTEICLRAEMEINVRLIGNFVTFTQLQGKLLRTQAIVVVMLEQAWKK